MNRRNSDTLNSQAALLTVPAISNGSPAPAMPPMSATTPLDGEACVLPMSFGQEQLWLIDQMAPGNTAYNVLTPLRIRGLLDVAALERTLNEIVRRHEVLRTTFDLDETGPVQIIAGVARLPFTVIDLSEVPEPILDAELLERMSAIGTLPFDLKHGPLCRAHLFTLSPEHHVLLWNMHHIVSDGWSYTILTEEIGSILSAFRRGEPSPLPEIPIQYADFSQWQREQFTPERIESEAAWWKRQLNGAPAFIDLPTDRSFGRTQSYDGRIRMLGFQPELFERLQSVAKEWDVTFFTVTLAAYFVLLHRYTGQTEIVIGTPTANRGRVELEQLIGYFVNTLPIRVSFGKHMTFHDLVTWLRSYLVEVFEHQELPLEKIVAKLALDRSTNRNPIFQVCFQCHKAFIRLPQVAGLEFSHIHIDRHGTPLDLNLAMIERDGQWRISAEYATAVFDEATVDRMLRHYQRLLESIALNPNEQISKLPLLTPTERSQLLFEWNQTKADYPRDRCLHELLQARAGCNPAAIAIMFGNQRLTYWELEERSNQLANHLRNLGVKPNTLVGLFLDRSLEMVVGMLAILKAGGAYMPMDPLHPRQRLAFMLGDAQPLVILTQHRFRNQLPPHQAHLICLDSDWNGISRESTSPPAQLSGPAELAYVIYTSGSTGQPKGVQISHRALVNFLTSMQSQPGIDASDVMLAVTTLSFDIAGLEIFLPLISGARVVIAPVEVMMDGVALATLVKHSGATIMQATPATWRLLLESGWAGEAKLKILCGGEAWTTGLADELLPRCRSLWNMYGPTETTIWSAAALVSSGQPVLMGRPIANTQFYILDQELQPVPVGVAGELHIGGDGLARGYLNRPELNLEKFIPNPFGGDPDTRLYKTGDFCRYRADGNIEYLSRMDYQVKIRGYRIELGEIEAVLARHPSVRNVVVAVREDVPGNKTLVAYLVPRQEPLPTVAELRVLLAQTLPDYMVPAAFIALPALPLTPNGKVDRKALPAPGENRLDQGVEFEAPSTRMEIALGRIWCSLLGMDRVSIHENFFAVGGHSLLAVRMVSEIRRQLAPDMPVRLPFQYPTIRELANVLSAQTIKGGTPELIQLQEGNAGPDIFLIVDGDSVGLFKLSRYMDKELRLHASVVPIPESALKASAKNQSSELPRMEDLAAYHVSLIKSRQPTSPIVLVGYCIAGMLAFEVAHQLQESGIKVEAVLMLNTWMKWPTKWWGKKAWLREYGGALIQEGPLYLWRKSSVRIKRGKADLAARLALAKQDGVNVLVPQSIVDRINRHAVFGYQLKPLASRGVLFVFEDDWKSKAYLAVDPSLGASGLFHDGLEVINIPANNVTVLDETHLATVAGYFNKCVRQFR